MGQSKISRYKYEILAWRLMGDEHIFSRISFLAISRVDKKCFVTFLRLLQISYIKHGGYRRYIEKKSIKNVSDYMLDLNCLISLKMSHLRTFLAQKSFRECLWKNG